MNAAWRGAAFALGGILTLAGCGVLLGHGIALAAEALHDASVSWHAVLWTAAGMAALGVPLLVWGSRTGGGAS